MNERIKKLRKALDLTQQKFADRLGLKQNTIATYEMGRSIPSDPAIKSICREFRVNETWLRTGEGDMFVQHSRADEIAAFMDRLAHGEPDDIWRRFVSSVSKLNTEELRILEKVAINLVGEIPKTDCEVPAATGGPITPPPAEPHPAPIPEDLVRELEELKRQNQEIIRQNQEVVRQNQEMAAELAALREEEAEQGEIAETEEKLSTFAEEKKMLA